MSTQDRLETLLRLLRLPEAIEILPAILKDARNHEKSTSSLLVKLLEAVLAAKSANATSNRMKRAGLPEDWSIESFPFHRQPALDRAQILELAELGFVRELANLCFIGDVGVGKTGLAIGLGRVAVLAGHSVLFVKTYDLLDSLFASTLDRSTNRLLRRLARWDLLILEEFSNITPNEEQANMLFKLVDARYRKKSTILTSNIGFDDWGTFFPIKALTKSLIDRVTDECHVIRIEGPSLRAGPRKRDSDAQRAQKKKFLHREEMRMRGVSGPLVCGHRGPNECGTS